MENYKAGFFRRLVALFLDSIFFIILLFFIAELDYDITMSEKNYALAIWSLFLVYFLYFVFSESSKKQATMGKFIMNIKVVNGDGYRLTGRDSFFRSLMKFVFCIITFNISFLMALFNDKGQTLYDMNVNTMVVNDNEKSLKIDICKFVWIIAIAIMVIIVHN